MSVRKKRFSHISSKGQILIEIIVATAIFMVIISGIVPFYLGVFDAHLRSTNKLQADLLLQQGLEATRSIRDQNYSNLVNGTYGLSRASGYWVFSENPDISSKFTRTITIADVQRDYNCNIVPSGGTIDPSSKKITATITWNYKSNDSATISGNEYLTDWRNQAGCGQSSNLIIDLSGATLSSGNRRITGVTLRNIGPTPITIDKITPYWDNAELIEEIKIGSIIEWKYNNIGTPTGKQPSGVELDIDNFTLPGYSALISLDHFFFTDDMSGATFTIYFKMRDGSVRYQHITF